MEYKAREIEQKWLAWWEQNEVYKVKTDPSRPKYYVLDMFPYPSGAGLHVGHPLGYIASDILARYKRLRGFNVLHPMGFDAFGLPAEQYAIENGIHPEVSTNTNIERYVEQLKNIGFSFDWSRRVSTCEPSYYKWTQWIFLEMFNSWYSLAADKAFKISELTALFEKEGNANVKAATTQETIFSADEWAAFSEKERDDVLMNYRLMYRKTGTVNWCEALGTVLANDEVVNGVSERGGHPVEQRPMLQWKMRILAYAERLLGGLEKLDFPESLKSMQRAWIGRSEGAQVFFDLDGHDEKLEIFTTRPDTIFGATFMVLAPEHDLVEKITTAVQRKTIENYLEWVGSRSELDRMAEKTVSGAFTGAFAIHPFSGEKIPVWISEYVLKGYGTGAIMAVPADDERDQKFAEKFGLPVVQIVDKSMHPGAGLEDKLGRMVNSDFLDGLEVVAAIQKIIDRLETQGIGKRRINFKLRDANYSRQRYWGEPFPIFYDKNGVSHALPETELPLLLPEMSEIKPGIGGKGPLSNLTEWMHMNPTPDPSPEGRGESRSEAIPPLPSGEGSGVGFTRRETDTMPGFAGSSWYFLRYMDPQNPDRFASKEAIDYWQDVDFYIGGAEHAVGHLMYSRMWHKFLFDQGLVPTDEPYKKLVNQGMIQGRSSFVCRANESFYEEYLWVKVLLPFFSENRPIRLEPKVLGDVSRPDFEFETNDLAIEVISLKLNNKISRIRRSAELVGKRLLVLFSESLIEHINQPEWAADCIRDAINSREKFILLGEKSPRFQRLYISHDLLGKYCEDSFSKLHVDINLVQNDQLDIERAALRPQFAGANFKLNTAGKFVCNWEVEKMSKSKYNVVNPDAVIDQFGADCFRMYEMFLGPIEQGKPWDTKGITGVQGFLRKFWSLFFNENGPILTENEPTKEELRILHTAIKRVTEDIERFSMNTCVSNFMIATNDLRKLNCSKRAILEPLVVLLAPFGPHISEELWHRLGHETTVCEAAWPIFNDDFLKTDTINYPIQVNGKLRGTIELPADADQAAVQKAVLELENVVKHMEGRPLKKLIFVPGRLVNVVA